MSNLVIYSLPVSGGYFVNQLGLLRQLFRALQINKIHSPTPDIVLCSSGGNASLYIAMAGGWTIDGVERVLMDVSSDMFISSWCDSKMDFISTITDGIANGSVYNCGYGYKRLLEKYFTKESIMETEIWMGTYNKNTSKAELFCNKPRNKALIEDFTFDHERELLSTTSLRYIDDPSVCLLGGSLENSDIIGKISKIGAASASIPYLVKTQQIDDYQYIDGGVMFASPTYPLQKQIINLVRGISSKECVPHKKDSVDHEEIFLDCEGNINKPQRNNSPKRLRHYYFCSSDLDVENISVNQMLKMIPVGSTMNQLLHSVAIIDRISGFDLIKTLCKNKSKLKYLEYSNLTFSYLSKILNWLNFCAEHYSIILYPHRDSSVNISDFKGKDAIKQILIMEKHYGAKILALLI